ncbi:hypothetical protein BXA13_04855 [Campylobacter lari]|uniref:Uncharacterized protein n=1 Tax=Campylobacter lari TaxID=201 RepID=A0A7U8GG03_CAMLA|nr:hypothetical protein [Campylobacter sp. CNRCH_2016_3089]EAJ5681636.1 hypothetical protein [Campylobacter lari]MCV3508359.1 hypothetical protein [Campylobacter sp. CNRCH_2016_3089]
MIFITIQDIEGDSHTSIKNGVFLKDIKQEKEISNLYKIINTYKLDGNHIGFKKLPNNLSFYVIKHPIKDKLDRTRLAMIIMDENLQSKNVKDSINKAGLNYDDFLNLQKQDNSKIYKISGILLLLIAATLIYIATKD